MTARVVIPAKFMGLPVSAELAAVGAAGSVTVSARLMGRDGAVTLSVAAVESAIGILRAAAEEAKRQRSLPL